MQKSKFKIRMQNLKSLKSFSLLLTLLFFYFFLFTFQIYAHVLKTDGNIGAVLHINPNDEPRALQPANLVFEFKDKKNAFQSNNCDCIFSVIRNGKTIYSQPLFQDVTTNAIYAAVQYTFPKSDIYQVQVNGNPLTNTSFAPFHLSWDIRVDEANNQQTNTKNTQLFPSYFFFFTIVIIGGIILGVKNIPKKNI